MTQYKYGDEAICESCGRRIRYMGAYWEHIGERPRHQAYPIRRSEAFVNEPMPKGEGQPVLPHVLKDLQARAQMGLVKYGTLLRIDNGRNADMDAYQGALDLVMYLKQRLLERSSAMVEHGPMALDIMFDAAHNATGDEFIDFTDEDWQKVAKWERHLVKSFNCYIDDLKFDLEHPNGTD